MLRCLSGLTAYRISAVDGEIGKVKDFFFDDAEWVVRYFVVDAGSWLNRNRVLIPPALVHQPEWEGRILPVSLTVEQVKNSPDVDTDKPVSRQHELAIAATVGLAPYWAPMPDAPPLAVSLPQLPLPPEEVDGDTHLRSVNHVTGYRVHATDGEIGKAFDFIADDEKWSIRYVALATGDWLPEKKVLVAPKWIEYVSWEAREVAVSLSREDIRNSPDYDPLAPVNREYEVRLYDYYGRPRYWE